MLGRRKVDFPERNGENDALNVLMCLTDFILVFNSPLIAKGWKADHGMF